MKIIYKKFSVLSVLMIFIVGCTSDTTPLPIYRKYDVIIAGTNHSVAINKDGTLWTWGGNTFGQLGNGTNSDFSSVPIKIGSDTDWAILSAGEYFSLGVKNNGTLWAWGNNTFGQLGTANTVNKNTPTQIGTDTNWKTVSAGANHSLAIKTDGSLWSWGRNDNQGQLGDGTIINRESPVQIGTDRTWTSISAGSHHSVALQINGSLWMWGNNGNGEFGDGSNVERLIPTQIMLAGSTSIWKAISAGENFTVGIKTNGTLWASGKNDFGQLGDGTNVDKIVFTQIGSSIAWLGVDAGRFHTVAKKHFGIWTWGNNSNGQLADGTLVSRNTPFIVSYSGYNNDEWLNISAGGNHTFTRLHYATGDLYSFGQNDFGQLGFGSSTDESLPVKVIN